jgi:hypothetical protein
MIKALSAQRAKFVHLARWALKAFRDLRLKVESIV